MLVKKASKASRLRALLTSPELEFLCEVHNGLSAKIVEEAGFKGMWGSGLSISAALGVRDNNEASWTEVLDVVDFIGEATSIPLLLDGDTGYGNFNNVRRLVKKLGQMQVAGVAIEDKVFPKTNSFLREERQPLADMDEFAGKIKAAKDSQEDPDFCVVARVEALIAGWGLGEALRRADAYHKAGADGILIHSKKSVPDEVLAFQKEWAGRCPVVIVPTKYYSTPTDVFRKAGFSVSIWANHLVRSAAAAMQQTARQIAKEQTLINVEDRIVPVAEIFRLQGDAELEEAEKRYLPGAGQKVSAVILAASRGKELGALTESLPKALLPVGGKPLLYRQVDTLNEVGVKDITVVRGFRKELISAANLRYADNDAYESTQELESLRLGLEKSAGSTLVAYGDILYKKYIPELLLAADDDILLAVDSDWRPRRKEDRYGDFVSCDRAYRKEQFDHETRLLKMGPPKALPAAETHGEWIGLMKLSAEGLDAVKAALAELRKRPDFAKLRMAELLNELVRAGRTVKVQYVRGHWLDVDDVTDLGAAGSF